MTVYVNDTPVKVFAGMSVKHALIAYDMETYAAATRSEVEVTDARGLRVGLEGAIHEGARLQVRPRPAMDQASEPFAR